MGQRTIAVAADHHGWTLKEQLKKWLTERGYAVRDFGAATLDSSDDYPDFGRPAARFVAADPAARRGLLICGSGQGMAIVANRLASVRAIVVDRSDGLTLDAAPNVLALAAERVDAAAARLIVDEWLASADEPLAPRHQRRIETLEEGDADRSSIADP
jgi:ribose 5-phosphate isomerase B